MDTQLVLNLGPALMPDFATGAMFHAILASPTAEYFQKTSEELMAGVMRLTKAENPALARSMMNQRPWLNWASIEARAQQPRSALGYLSKRLTHRMAAARMGIGKLHEQIFGMPVVLPAGITSLSLDQLCTLIRSDVSIDDPHNIEALVWRKSLPILHLAMATQLLLAGKYGTRAKLGCDLQDIEFYREAVGLGQLLEQVVHDHPEVPITRDRLTQVRWWK